MTLNAWNGLPDPRMPVQANTEQERARVLFNPYTGERRHINDVQSDPQGLLIVAPGAELQAARRAPVVPNELREAAQAVVERWDSPNWKDLPATGEYIARLRKALAAAPQPKEADHIPDTGKMVAAPVPQPPEAHQPAFQTEVGAAPVQLPEPALLAHINHLLGLMKGLLLCDRQVETNGLVVHGWQEDVIRAQVESTEHQVRQLLAAQPIRIAEICAQMCESRASSLVASGQATAANEAKKCASVLRNPPDAWREKLLAAQEQSNGQQT